MDTRHLRIPPDPARTFPSGQDPAVVPRVGSYGGDAVTEDLVVIRLGIESRCSLQHYANLATGAGLGLEPTQIFPAEISYPEFHLHVLFDRGNRGAKDNAVGQGAGETQDPVGPALPVDVLEHNILLLPNGRDICVRQEKQAE